MSETLGAVADSDGTRFSLWASHAQSVEVRFFADGRQSLRTVPLAPQGQGLFQAHLPGVAPGMLYKWVVDGVELTDPYARFLPFGVDGPAEIIAPRKVEPLADRPPLHRMVLYELHVGTFTEAGNYAAASERLPILKALGVNAIELLPLSAFPGERGWGYDGVAHFSPYAPYGRPGALRAFVEKAHALGLMVFLDVVYNHFGPHGSTLGATAAEYFARDGDNPWGGAPDYTQPHMRAYLLDNARMWFEEYGIDGLRLDATHAIKDPSPRHILKELAALAHGYATPRWLMAEDDRNDPMLIAELGLDAQWADDFHHQVHVLLTGEQDGYYAGYAPTVEALAQTIQRGWFYEGQTYPAWGKPRGKSAAGLLPEQLVYCIQNHDQIGNRALGNRLTTDVSPEAFEVATALLLFLPTTPLLFMGQEWAASAPFLFFTDHGPELGVKVSEGRRNEFAKFAAFADPAVRHRIPDPQAASTFTSSKLNWAERETEPHRHVWGLTQSLLRLRREDAVLSARCDRSQLLARTANGLLIVERRGTAGVRTLLANFGAETVACDLRPYGEVLLATAEFGREGLPARSALVLASPPDSAGGA